MDHEKMGRFIYEQRKSKQMTQKDLAAKLNVTDKAVSKWERGLSSPDISLLSALAEALGVTPGELLNGEKGNAAAPESAVVGQTLQYAEQAVKSSARTARRICTLAFSVALFIGAAVCMICDLAITGRLTWSPIPVEAMVFSWMVFFPVVCFGGRGVWASLLALSVLIVPYLYVLDRLLEPGDLLLLVGVPMSAVGVAYFWIVFVLFRVLRSKKRIAAAVALLLAIPISLLINFILSGILNEPILDVWDMLSFCIVAALAAALVAVEIAARRKKQG
jgi:transcriptional regulator with XRE-family HTH domain